MHKDVKGRYRYSQLKDANENINKKTLVLNNVGFFNNQAEYGGSIDCWDIELCLINVTMCNNFADNGGGSIWGADSTAIIVNSIIWNNLPDNFHDSYPKIYYSDVMGSWPGIGNINTDPMFVDTANGDYRLQSGSPCIDKGIQDTMFIYNHGHDTLIVPAISYLGSAPDMGAYEFDPSTAIAEKTDLPKQFILSQNYPNPFNPITTITYQIPVSSKIDLSIYNLLGQKVATLVNKKQPAGTYEVQWGASKFASGIYIYRLKANPSGNSRTGGQQQNAVFTKKLVLLK